MRSWLLAVVFLFTGWAALAQSAVNLQFVQQTFFPATVLLYGQDGNGNMRMRCTGTAIEKTDHGYVFVTAAHCVCKDDTDEHTVSPEAGVFFYVTADEFTNKEFLRAEPLGCGYRHRGDDFALLSVKTDRAFPLVSLGRDAQTGEAVVNVASPMGLGKQMFYGIVSASEMNRPVVEDDINWTNAILLQMFGVNGGSSGSAVVCVDQKAICAFVVGTAGQSSIVAMPVSRLCRLKKDLADHKYDYWKANVEDRALSTKPAKAGHLQK